MFLEKGTIVTTLNGEQKEIIDAVEFNTFDNTKFWTYTYYHFFVLDDKMEKSRIYDFDYKELKFREGKWVTLTS